MDGFKQTDLQTKKPKRGFSLEDILFFLSAEHIVPMCATCFERTNSTRCAADSSHRIEYYIPGFAKVKTYSEAMEYALRLYVKPIDMNDQVDLFINTQLSYDGSDPFEHSNESWQKAKKAWIRRNMAKRNIINIGNSYFWTVDLKQLLLEIKDRKSRSA